MLGTLLSRFKVDKVDDLLRMARKRDIKLVDSIVEKLGLSKPQRELLHQAIEDIKMGGEDLSYSRILEEAKDIQQQFPKK